VIGLVGVMMPRVDKSIAKTGNHNCLYEKLKKMNSDQSLKSHRGYKNQKTAGAYEE
jgi:hypothetical protein